MKPGKNRSIGHVPHRRRCGLCRVPARLCASGALAVCVWAAGCAHNAQHRADVGQKLMGQRSNAAVTGNPADFYQIGCPDVLMIAVADRTTPAMTQTVAADGRIDLGTPERPRVEGLTPAQAAAAIAADLDVPTNVVQVRVAEYRSQQLFLFGQIVGWQRSIPYQGQETVLEALQRVGGITPGAELRDIYVVRAHVAEGIKPEIFHVDLEAIATGQDTSTNLRLWPNDQIYVGEARRVRMEKAIPPLVRRVMRGEW